MINAAELIAKHEEAKKRESEQQPAPVVNQNPPEPYPLQSQTPKYPLGG